MYSGIYDFHGNPMPSILQNKSRSQDMDTFVTNQDTKRMFMWRLIDAAMSVFRWDGLPEGVDERMLEWWLLRDGFCGFFYDEALKSATGNPAPEGYAVLPLMLSGEWDIYEYPQSREAYSVSGFRASLDASNSVIIFNNYLRVPMWLTIEHYASRLAEVQRSIDINVRQQRTARMIMANDKTRLSLLNAAAGVDEGKPWILATKDFDLDAFQSMDITSP